MSHLKKDSSLDLPNCNATHFERKTGKTGGMILLYVHNNLINKVRDDLSTSDVGNETLVIEIVNTKSKNSLVTTCYRPPKDRY